MKRQGEEKGTQIRESSTGFSLSTTKGNWTMSSSLRRGELGKRPAFSSTGEKILSGKKQEKKHLNNCLNK